MTPRQAPALDSLDSRIAKAIFLCLWLLYASIGPGLTANNPNSAGRMGFIFSVIQQHSVTIDGFASSVKDKAEFEGHTYMDKAPGQSLTALPVVALSEFATRMLGKDTTPIIAGDFTPFFVKSIWLGVLATTALFTAAAAAMLYLLALGLGLSRGAALFGALGYALCTPAFGWATVFFSHNMAGACLFIGFALTLLATGERTTQWRTARTGFLAGLLLAWAVVVEFTSVPAALLIACIGCWRLRALAPSDRARMLIAAIAGGLIGAIPLAIYNQVAFGSVTHVGYDNVVGFDGMQTGLFGVSLPRADVLAELLWGTQRGILWLSPLLLMAPFAWAASYRRFGVPITLALVAIPITYLLINSGYAYWDGGASTGPRHIMPMLPFIGLALVPLWEAFGRRLRIALLALTALSFVLSLACATFYMTAPIAVEGIGFVHDELFEFILPHFLAGDVHHLLAPDGNGGLLSLGWLLVTVLLEIAASGVVPMLRRHYAATKAAPHPSDLSLPPILL